MAQDSDRTIPYLTKADVARELGVTPAWVRVLSDRGRLPVAARTASGVRLYDAAVVDILAVELRRAR